MMQSHIITILIFIPLFGALFMLMFARDDSDNFVNNSRMLALWSSIVTFIASLAAWYFFDYNVEGFQFIERYRLVDSLKIDYFVGIDGISLSMILLTCFLVPICILISANSIKYRVKEFFIAFLVMESFIIGAFAALDVFLFYSFFEIILVPMFFIIGIWGGEDRVYSSYKFFIYTFAGSVMFLLSLIYLNQEFDTSSIVDLMVFAPTLPYSIQMILWIGMFASFAVKIPMWPFHTWLPDAHVQAPTAGSVILAGVLLKLGAYGFLRFSLPMLPLASEYFSPFVMFLSIAALVITSLIALAQTDMKKLIAYSSVAHMGYVTAGIFTMNHRGVEGAIIQMISHGLVSAALFICVGVVYDRFHTREINRFGGLADKMPFYGFAFLIFIVASAGLPGTSGFVGEFLVIIGSFEYAAYLAIFMATGMLLGATYSLWLYRRVMFGQMMRGDTKNLTDLNFNEKASLVPLIVVILLIGIYPKIILDALHKPVDKIIEGIKSPPIAYIKIMDNNTKSSEDNLPNQPLKNPNEVLSEEDIENNRIKIWRSK